MKQAGYAVVAALVLVLTACSMMPSSKPKGPDLSGEWVLTTESQMGSRDAQMTVRQNGSALTGTLVSEDGTVDYTGTLNGNDVAFAFTINVQGMDLKLDYSGVVEGDTMKGKTVFGQFGEGTFSAKRKM